MERVWMTLNLLRGDGDCPTANTGLYVRFPVYSDGQRTISLWFYNSVQEGDGIHPPCCPLL